MYSFICAPTHTHTRTYTHTHTALRHTFGSSYCMPCNLFVCPLPPTKKNRCKYHSINFVHWHSYALAPCPLPHGPLPLWLLSGDCCLTAKYCSVADFRTCCDNYISNWPSYALSPTAPQPNPLCSRSNCLLLHSFLRRVCMKIWSIICTTKARTTNGWANGRMGPRPIHQSCLPCLLFLFLLLLLLLFLLLLHWFSIHSFFVAWIICVYNWLTAFTCKQLLFILAAAFQ